MTDSMISDDNSYEEISDAELAVINLEEVQDPVFYAQAAVSGVNDDFLLSFMLLKSLLPNIFSTASEMMALLFLRSDASNVNLLEMF